VNGARRLGQLRQFRLDGGLVDLGGFVEQVRLTPRQGLALLAEAQTLRVRQLQGERLDFDRGRVQVLLCLGQFGPQPVHLAEGLCRWWHNHAAHRMGWG
jgi:hypothetical protein